jgi:hypothetical protein
VNGIMGLAKRGGFQSLNEKTVLFAYLMRTMDGDFGDVADR